MNVRVGGAILICLCVAYGLAFQAVAQHRGMQALEEHAGYLLPAPLAKFVLAGFDGIASDMMFIRTASFVQGHRVHGKKLVSEDWDWVAALLDRATEFDPHFRDPYYFGQAFLTWDGGKVREANALLEKAVQHRSEDWVFPFFIGFNHFYFLQDYPQASTYIMKASRIAGSPPYLAGLAARLAVRGNETQAAVDFLREALAKTEDEGMRGVLSVRLAAFEGALMLERAVAEYRRLYGSAPPNLQTLLKKGILSAIPVDPYGGVFYLDENAMVKTTSGYYDARSSPNPGSQRIPLRPYR